MLKKRINHSMLTVALFAISLTSNAQIFFNQDFEGTMQANGLPLGWAETGLSTDGIFLNRRKPR